MPKRAVVLEIWRRSRFWNLALLSDQAAQAALAEVPGTVVKTELDNENGNVVYSVEIDTGSGVKDVKVDAGNGKVLYVDVDDPNEPEGEKDNDAKDGD